MNNSASTRISIRDATVSDLPDITNLSKLLFQFESQEFVGEKYNTDWPATPQGQSLFRERIINPKGIVKLAIEADKPIGYISGYFFVHSARNPAEMASVENMFVLERHRNQGVGKHLFTEFAYRSKALGAKTIRVTSLDSNTPALNFYKQLSFQEYEMILELPID